MNATKNAVKVIGKLTEEQMKALEPKRRRKLCPNCRWHRISHDAILCEECEDEIEQIAHGLK